MGVLRVPIALDAAAEYVRPEDADDHARFTCPECDRRLGVRGGGDARVRRHFFHVDDARASSCSFGGAGEGPIHATAKHAVIAALRSALVGGPAPRVDRECPRCRSVYRRPVPLKKMGVCSIRDEYRHHVEHEDFTPVADIALLDGQGEPVFFIEVRASHAVDDYKAAALDLKWLELDASALIASPLLWVPVRSGRLDDVPCNCAGKLIVISDGRFVNCPADGRHITMRACERCKHHQPKLVGVLRATSSILCGAPEEMIAEQRERERAQRRREAEQRAAAEVRAREREAAQERIRQEAAAREAEAQRLEDERRAKVFAENQARAQEEERARVAARDAARLAKEAEAAEAKRAEEERWMVVATRLVEHGKLLKLFTTDDPPPWLFVDPSDEVDVKCPKVSAPVHHTSCLKCPHFLARIVSEDRWQGVVCGEPQGATTETLSLRSPFEIEERYVRRAKDRVK